MILSRAKTVTDAEEDEMIFHIRRGRYHQIRCQERERKLDSMSGEEDRMRFHVRKARSNHI
jgi:hypothetical protein